MLLLIGALTWWNAARLVDTFRWVEHTQEVIGDLNETLVEVLNMQVGARNYLLLGDETYLEAYRHAAAESRRRAAIVRQLTADQPAQRARIDALDPLLAEAAVRLQARIDLRQAQGVSTATEAKTSRSHDIIVRIRQTIGEMRRHEEQLLAQRSAAVVHALELTMACVVLGGALAIGLVTVAGILIGRDFRLRREAESKLERNRAMFESLFENAADGLIVVSPAGSIVRLNRTAERLFGHTRSALIGHPVEALLPEAFRAAHAAKNEDAPADGFAPALDERMDYVARRADGSTLPVEIMLSPLETDDGRVTLATVRDLTRRRAAEQKITQLNADLQRQNGQLTAAVAELEAFSYSVSHDLRAPLRHIDGFSALLGQHLNGNADETSTRYLDTIGHAAQRMGRLIDDLLAFSRAGRTPVKLEPVAHDHLLATVIRELNLSGSTAPIAWQIAPLPTLPGDPALLHQVWSNLVENAVKYSSKNPAPRIEIGAQLGPDGTEWIFFVRDNGVGFDMRHVDKLFGVFQRLHAMSEFPGTGIGLANVRRIVTRHGGRTWAEGVKGTGATFYFSLPRDAAAVAAVQPPAPAVAS
ncbi:CHASE3 domain-containing protein [Horticoccus luteus]|uniref:histidine kinase n=1 Tax=Horticoccus luteus TaxID=2862869 RepID=A0A8F9TS54_9BACT|nr:CHASE3 domain-containing protein [Horticoccus luteus]QYM78030.1 CHASE3 domain-containing protein [Horticoccus luteus]